MSEELEVFTIVGGLEGPAALGNLFGTGAGLGGMLLGFGRGVGADGGFGDIPMDLGREGGAEGIDGVAAVTSFTPCGKGRGFCVGIGCCVVNGLLLDGGCIEDTGLAAIVGC